MCIARASGLNIPKFNIPMARLLTYELKKILFCCSSSLLDILIYVPSIARVKVVDLKIAFALVEEKKL